MSGVNEQEARIENGPTYQEKFGFGCEPMIAVLFTVGCVLALVFLQDQPMDGSAEMPLFVKLALYGGAALGLFGIVRLLVVVARGRVALRVDGQGVRMNRLVFRDKAAEKRTQLVPWGTFDLIVLQHEQTAQSGTDTFLSLRKYAGDKEVVVARTPRAGWSLDRERFLATVRYYAPGIEFDERHNEPRTR